MLTLTQNEKTKLKLQRGTSSPSHQISWKFYNIVLVRTEENEALSYIHCWQIQIITTLEEDKTD